MEQTRVIVGRIGKPHGIRGEVSLELRTDEPEVRFAPGSSVFSQTDPSKKFTVVTTRWHAGRLLVTFKELADRNAAEAARNTILQAEVDPAELPVEADEFYDRQLIGLVVELNNAAIGEIADILHLPSQDVLQIALDAGGELLLPFVEQFVPEINFAQGFITITPPAGLMELADEN
jgi:16S rRNA processing protein RimM